MTRYTADSITDDALDALYARLDKTFRALDRAHALAEGWDGSDEAITRTQAAELLSSAIELNGWDQIDDPRVERLACLYAVPTPTPERSA